LSGIGIYDTPFYYYHHHVVPRPSLPELFSFRSVCDFPACPMSTCPLVLEPHNLRHHLGPTPPLPSHLGVQTDVQTVVTGMAVRLSEWQPRLTAVRVAG
jgi:hypothetical protein